MRLLSRRISVGMLSFVFGMIILASSSSNTVADVPENTFQIAFEQNVKHLNEQLKDGKPDKRGPIQIKSSAMIVAAFAQSKITGKDAASDAKFATIRNHAVKVAEAVAAKKFADAVEPAKHLKLDAKAADKIDTKPLSLHELAKFDINDLMAQYKKVSVGGLGIEDDIRANSKKLKKETEHAALGYRVMITSDFVDKLEPDGGFSAKKSKKVWDDSNKQMKEAAQELIDAASGKSADPMKLVSIYSKLDLACTNCHNVFK